MLQSMDSQGRLIEVSDAWLAKFGYRRDEALGRPFTDFLAPESRERAIREIAPALRGRGRIDDAEYRMVCRDGRVIDVLMSAKAGRIATAILTDVSAIKARERRLAESEARYRGLVEDQTELVALSSLEGELRFVNHAYARLYAKTPQELLGMNLFDFIPAEGRAAVRAHFQRVCESGESIEDVNQVILPDGRTRWIAWTNRTLKDAEGRFIALHSVGRDVEQRVAQEQRLRDSEARYRLLADHSADVVFQLDLDLVRRYVSPACREILGYEPEEMVGIKPVDVTHPDDAPRMMAALQLLLEGRAERRSIVNRLRHRDGRWIWIEAELRALKDARTGAVSGVIGALRDISARKAIEVQLAEANLRLEALAEQDPLTGLGNRRHFDAALVRECRRARRENTCLGLMMIDVDWFKAYNDLYGHQAGDACLKRVAAAISAAIRRPGDRAARYGGEEFAVLLPGADEQGVATIGERIRQTLREQAIEHSNGLDQLVSVSIGVASSELGAPEGPEALLRNADRALYLAKARGRNALVRATALPKAA